MITLSSTAPKNPIPPLIRIRDVATLLAVSRCTVYALIDSGDLKASKVNSSNAHERLHRRVTRESLLEFYKKRFGHALNHALENPFKA
jgi:excisionase family DNA binding protein